VTGFVARGAGRSETGRVREVNEDRLMLLDDAGRGAALYSVADGLGGHVGGSIASELAVSTLATEVPALLAQGSPPREALAAALRRANAIIRARAATLDLAGMATTCTALLVAGGEGIVAHVGDTRAYLLRGREMHQLTTDHSLVSELVRQGGLAPSRADAHAQRHVLTRALGSDSAEIDLVTEPLRAGDVLVLTSDGLHTAVSAEEIGALVQATPDADEACRALLGLANARGGFDNASVVVVRLTPRWVMRAFRLLAPAVLAALLLGGWGAYRLENTYFLGVRGDRVAVMQGVPARVLGVPLFSVVRVTPISVDQVAPAYRSRLDRGLRARSATEAESMLHDLVSRP